MTTPDQNTQTFSPAALRRKARRDWQMAHGPTEIFTINDTVDMLRIEEAHEAKTELASFIDRWSDILNDGPLTADNVHAFDAHGEQR
jgi:hypothetical protein